VRPCFCPCTVAQVREKELELIRQTAVIKTLNLCLVFAVPPAIALVIFATYAYSVGKLTSSMAFVVLSLFNTLRFPLVVLPKALRGASGTGPGPACSRSDVLKKLSI
jgi:Na+/H+-dicarboxylate symporter